MPPADSAIPAAFSRYRLLSSSLLLSFLSSPLAHAQQIVPEVTFSWTGGLAPWSDDSRWLSNGNTGTRPNDRLHVAWLGENNNARVILPDTGWSGYSVGRLRIESGSALEINEGTIYVSGAYEGGDNISGAGQIRGKGEILLNQTLGNRTANLYFNYGPASLQGDNDSYLSGGTITMNHVDALHPYLNVGLFGNAPSLTNHDWLIHGKGVIALPFAQRPNGCVRADVTGSTLRLTTLIDANLGVLEATNGGTLECLYDSNPNRLLRQWSPTTPLANGIIRTATGGQIKLNGRYIEGGTLENLTTGPNASGRMELRGNSRLQGVTDHPLTINGRIHFQDDYYGPSNPSPNTLYGQLAGPIHNTGEIVVIGGDPSHGGYPGSFYFGDTALGNQAVLTGGGTITFALTDPTYFAITGPEEKEKAFRNVDNRIVATSNIQYSRGFINETAGQIGVSGTGNTFTLGGFVSTADNRGTLFAENGGTLAIQRSARYMTEQPLNNTNGTIRVTGDGSASSSLIEFVGGTTHTLLGGRVLNQNGRVRIRSTGSSYLYGSGWDQDYTFTQVKFEGTSPQGLLELQPGVSVNLYSCTLNGHAKVNGGIISFSNGPDGSSGFLFGNGELELANGEYNGQTYFAEIHVHGDRRYHRNGLWPVKNQLVTSCQITGSGLINVAALKFIGGGGITASGSGQVLDLSSCTTVEGGALRAQSGGLLKLTPVPGGQVTLPPGTLSSAISNGEIRVETSGNLLANDGGGLLANDGGGIVASGGGNIVASGGGNIVAAGGGNIVASGGGNIVASGGGNIVAAGGGNIVAGGAGNLLANGGNIVAGGAGNLLNVGGGIIAAGAGNIIASGGGNIVASGGGNIVAGGAGNILAPGGGNIVAGGAGNLLASTGGSFSVNSPSLGLRARSTGPEIRIESGGRLAPTTMINGQANLHGQTGIASLTGKFNVQSGGLVQCEIAGTTAGTGYDQTQVNGPVAFNGQLEIRILNGFISQLNATHSFTVLTTTGTLSGTPQNVSGGRIPTADGLGSFRFTATATSFILDDFAITPGLAQTFANFANSNDLSGTTSDDADHDGIQDFAEYAFGTHPNLADQPPAAVRESRDGVDCLVLRYRTHTSRLAAGLSLVAQASDNLQNWTTVGIQDQPDPEASVIAGTEARIAWIPFQGPKRFLRLHALQSP